MLGQGEALRELTVTVQQLLDRNERGLREYGGVSARGYEHLDHYSVCLPPNGWGC